MNCLKCNKETKTKFCSKRCSVSYNNKKSPRRQVVDRICTRCGLNLGKDRNKRSYRTICNSCYKQDPRVKNKILTETKGELRGPGNAVFGGRYATIRQHSRKSYIKSGLPMQCYVCLYDRHVDVCHIRDIKDFPETSLVSEINDISNLVALCKNHHWEFDNGYLKL